ncbi:MULTISPECIES: hypothetical protein [Prauserella salsuginis group]|uniref:Uncharacterized protein n=1 Tax=Prauserella salsuginis TaxID=387889 RepID=A0ABW6G7J8_9PSEU|nr:MULTISPECIES: hypothetical protein [Prauserella salsuginis group]MCR3719553.1 hypothetical protein [Prauserella flava]MCR3735433.1 hypothetical protein [Prauserella salsuginis]
MGDERDVIDFDTEYVLAEAFPGRVDAPAVYRRCTWCTDQQPWPAAELTVFKTRVSGDPQGRLLLYCPDHVDGRDAAGPAGTSGRTGPRCPQCWVEVPTGTGFCDMCEIAVG